MVAMYAKLVRRVAGSAAHLSFAHSNLKHSLKN